jgi:hypothetical protein
MTVPVSEHTGCAGGGGGGGGGGEGGGGGGNPGGGLGGGGGVLGWPLFGLQQPQLKAQFLKMRPTTNPDEVS